MDEVEITLADVDNIMNNQVDFAAALAQYLTVDEEMDLSDDELELRVMDMLRIVAPALRPEDSIELQGEDISDSSVLNF